MKKPQITTIIPTYRRPKMLRRAIRSVLAQTCPHFQVMVLDNASGDETPDVVAELAREDPRVRYHCHSENIGAGANFDYGVRHVETPFFSLLSDDDVVLPHFYETVMKGFEEHPSAMFSAGATVMVCAPNLISSVPMAAWAPGSYEPPEGAFEMLRKGAPTWTAILFRREVLDEAQFLDPETGEPLEGAFLLWIGLRFMFVVNTRPCAFLVSHPGTCSGQGGLGYWWPRWFNGCRHMMADPRINSEARERIWPLLTEKAVDRLIVSSIACVRRGRFDEAYEAGAILRRRFGKRVTGSLLQVLALTARCVPLAAPLLNALGLVRVFVGRRRAVRNLAKLRWEGLQEARRQLGLLTLTS